MDIIQVITKELNVEKWQVEAAVKLIDEGCTIPFISRYRKEATGSLNDEQLRTLHERLTYLRNLEEKKNQVLGSIEEQGKLTAELKKQILDAQTLVVVEDLYRPFRPKRRTRAIIAKEKEAQLLARYKLEESALALPPYDLLQAIGAKRGMLISGGEVDTERAAKMLVGEFRASKWGRLSLERPPQRAVQEEREEVTDDAPQDDWDDEQ